MTDPETARALRSQRAALGAQRIDPALRSARASLAANRRWAAEPDRVAATAQLRAGLLAKYEREARDLLGPAATDAQIAANVESALKAQYAKMQFESLKSRKNAARTRREALADAILDAETGGAA